MAESVITSESAPKEKFTIRDLDKIKYLKQHEIHKILKVARKSVRDYAIIAVSYAHGLRIAEVTLLQYEYWDADSERLFIKRVKNGISASYRVSTETAKAINNWVKVRGKASGPLFVSRMGVKGSREHTFQSGGKDTKHLVGISTRQLATIFKRYAETVGLPSDKCHFHALRHSIAVQMVDMDVPLMRIKDWLGHRNIASTMIYAQVSDRGRDNTLDLMGDVLQVDGSKRKLKKTVDNATGDGKVSIDVDWSKDRRR